MAEVLLSPFIDLTKHYIQINYITFVDNKLNLLVYSCLTIIITFLVKTICNYKNFITQIYYIRWFITYIILKYEMTIFPCPATVCPYSPTDIKSDFENNNITEIELVDNNKGIFLRLFGFRIEKYNSGNNTSVQSYRYNFVLSKEQEEIIRYDEER